MDAIAVVTLLSILAAILWAGAVLYYLNDLSKQASRTNAYLEILIEETSKAQR